MEIWPYEKQYRKQVEKVHYETGLLGKSMSAALSKHKDWKREISFILDDPDILGFVAVEDAKVSGYIVGSKRERSIRNVALSRLIPLLRYPLLPRKDRYFWRTQVGFIWRAAKKDSEERKLSHPDGAMAIHINMLPEFRKKGIGTRLMDAFATEARARGVLALHADMFVTRLNRNQDFWKKNGFSEFSKAKTSYWKGMYPAEEMEAACYLKKL